MREREREREREIPMPWVFSAAPATHQVPQTTMAPEKSAAPLSRSRYAESEE
jgi:hypothetical protein